MAVLAKNARVAGLITRVRSDGSIGIVPTGRCVVLLAGHEGQILWGPGPAERAVYTLAEIDDLVLREVIVYTD